VKVTIRAMDEKVWQEMKVAAIRAGKTVPEWLMEAIKEKLDKGER